MDYYKTLPVSPTTRYYNGNNTRNNVNSQKEFGKNKVTIEDIVLIKKNGLWGVYNTNGRELFPPIIDFITREFSDGLIVGRVDKQKSSSGSSENRRYVYFNQYGHKVLDSNEHVKMGEFCNGLALVEDEEGYGAYYNKAKSKRYRYFIDKNGNQVTELKEVSEDNLPFNPVFAAKEYKSYKEFVEYSRKNVKQLSLKI